MSGVVRLDNAATTTRWLVGQDEWLQIEMWQYENPLPRLTMLESVPNRVGFRRCGVWVKDFDETLRRLSELGTPPLTEPVGEAGKRRVCVRDLDGILVELFESDPLQERVAPAKYECNAALRCVSITTDDLAASIDFAERGLGLSRFEHEFHRSEDEALWGMIGADCERAVFASDAMLLEFIQYHSPPTLPRHPHARLNDQGILNIAFGDKRGSVGVKRVALQTLRAGAVASDKMQTPFGGCVYMTDPQGFSFEFMWARPGLGHRLTGYLPTRKNTYCLPENQFVQQSTWVHGEAESVFNRLSDFQNVSQWPSVNSIEILNQIAGGRPVIGLERQINTRFFVVKEQIVDWQSGRLFRYRLTSSGLFKNYTGTVECTTEGGGTRVRWSVAFRSKIPGLGGPLKYLIKYFLGRLIIEGGEKID